MGTDFRFEDPVWVRYAEYIGGGHDKYYEVRIDMDDNGWFVLTKRWGRRPDSGAGQTKTEEYVTINTATQAALSMLAEKIRKGYRECERPWGAGNKVRRENGPDFYDENAQAF